jgi:hypothetical protein
MTKDLISYAEGMVNRYGERFPDKTYDIPYQEGKSHLLQEILALLEKEIGEMEISKLPISNGVMCEICGETGVCKCHDFNSAKSEDIKLLQDTIEIIKKQI